MKNDKIAGQGNMFDGCNMFLNLGNGQIEPWLALIFIAFVLSSFFILGVFCAILARKSDRRALLWFLVGFVTHLPGLVFLISLNLSQPRPTRQVRESVH